MDNTIKHYLSSDQVMKAVFNPDASALDVVLSAGEMNFALNHKEDSINVFRSMVSLKNEAILECSDMSQVCLFGDAKVMVSPVMDADVWFELPMHALRPRPLLAMRIKMIKTDPNSVLLLKA
jgi:hypothetical protein